MWRAVGIACAFLAALSALSGIDAGHLKPTRAHAQAVQCNGSVDAQRALTFGGGGCPSGGGGISFGNETSGANTGCGFSGTCTVTGLTVSPGLVIATVSIGEAGSPPLALAGLSVCGTPLTQAVSSAASGVDTTGSVAEVWYGIIAGGGSCNAVATAGVSVGLQAFGIGLGTASGYSSSTPTSTCQAGTADTGGTGTLPCSSAVTVPSAGVALGAGTLAGAGSQLGSFTNMTNDITGTYAVLGRVTASGSLTPTFGTSSFTEAAVAAATWH